MKFTLNWLKDYLDTDATLDQVVDTLTRLGLEVEEVHDPANTLGVFTIAHVIEAKQHPNADKLRVCTVDTGRETVQVVCGAPNAKTGMKGVFAASGTAIPGTGLLLKPTEIRGVLSNGMLCSEHELEISDEHDGIIELDKDAPIGERFIDYAGLNDPVIEIAITPNRQDCLGVYGIARDLAAAGLGRLKPIEVEPVSAQCKSNIAITRSFDKDHEGACPQFMGRLFKNVKNGPSPSWLQTRLKAIGLRPISALVDITNYITHAYARPLHVYDAAKLKGNIGPRMAKAGESFLALDDNEYALTDDDCVIADDSGVLGLGGIIGGMSTGCSLETTDVFLEAALFDATRTAFSGRAHQIITDSRFRFERGVDQDFVETGLELASRLIVDLCGGEASDIMRSNDIPAWDKKVTFNPKRVMTLGGLTLDDKTILSLLEGLSFTSEKKGDTYQVSVPSWRTDIVGEEDLVEEVTRLYGYDNIPVADLPRTSQVSKPTLSPRQIQVKSARRSLATQGLMECVTFSFMPSGDAKLFLGDGKLVLLENPISAELDAMRPSILPNLLKAAQRNMDRSIKSVALFEIGPQYAGDDMNEQHIFATGIRTGQKSLPIWHKATEAVSAFDAKADALLALEAAGAPVKNLAVFDGAPSWYHPGRSGTLRLGPKQIIASFGEIHPAILKKLDVSGPAVGFEINLGALPISKKKATKSKGALIASPFQPVERDFAFVVEHTVNAANLMKAAESADKKHISAVRLFDVFAGPSLGEGKKSLAITVTLSPDQATFTDAEIEQISNKIVETVHSVTGGILRQ